MKSNELKCFIEQLHQLPTLPPVAVQLLDLVNDEDSGLNEVARLIELDPALCSKILRIANSLHFGMSRQITTVELATRVLGLDLVRSVALSLIAFDFFKPQTGQAIDLTSLWSHSVSCAIASELLARRFGHPKPKEAFIAGLLHDLGKLVLLYWNREEYETVINEARAEGRLLLEVEEDRLGMGHTQAAKLLMGYWKFPSLVVDAAWLHHQPVSHFGPEPQKQVSFIVKCANNLCHLYRLGDSGNTKADLSKHQLQQISHIPSDELVQLFTEVFRRFEEVSKQFDLESCSLDLYMSAVSQANQEVAQMEIELSVKNRQLTQQQTIMTSICQLQEQLSPRITTGRAMEKILKLLQQTTSGKRLMGFLFLEQEGLVEGRMKMGPKIPMQRMVFPVILKPGEQASRLKSREQYFLIKQAILQQEDTPGSTAQLKEFLESGDLIVLPLETNSATLGQIVIELEGSEWNKTETVALLRQYAREAASALERVLLVEALDQQTENLARLVRKEQEIQTQLHQAQQLASVGSLAAGAAHEINNPLGAISLQAEILLKQAKKEDERKAPQLILDQSTRISKIINDLMGFARPTEPTVAPANAQTILEETLRVLENRIKIAQVELRKEYQSPLPLINADPQQLEQVFLNLIINALQAMKTGGVLTLRVGVDEAQTHLAIAFEDTGIGIKPDQLSSIFDPFYTTKEAGEGTGLGLAISYSIVTNHNGQINASSHPGHGSTFTVLLPLADPSGPPRSDLLKSSLPEERVDVLQPRTRSILIIEHELAVGIPLAELLYQSGYQVDIALDGIQGLAKLDEHSYDVTLLDLRIPCKEGLEVLETLRKNVPQMPVIVVSGASDDQSLKSAEEAGAFACLKKPFNLSEVMDVIQRAP